MSQIPDPVLGPVDWPEALRTRHGSAPGVLSVAVDQLMPRAMAASQSKVLVSAPDGSYAEFAGSPEAGAVPAGTWCFMNIEQQAPALRNLLRPAFLSRAAVARVNAYVSPPGIGAPLHFDARAVVIVQLAGQKRWAFSADPAVSNPHRNCVIPENAQEADYGDGRLARPETLYSVDLKPGDWLVVPRGIWHCTEALSRSVSATLAAPAGYA